ncbi:riboflavin synthase subunit alpha [Advenella kashmirensis W13003]|uniref:Riboflavin synthase n=1 Tax=Advenella kashmirensis W13003 TaxID=1424334 RepID=V8QP27_9BURK|nr:riboflavin synthase [Advenella kashmirensis]ETF01050.1 riboflavin synthase subunit alpha [Advenella kashmirensis W13003]
MFTGIISGVGRISEVKPAGASADDGVHLTIEANNFDMSGIGLGDSIAVQGACMTVVSQEQGTFQVDVSRESLDKTTGLDAVGSVNLERSLKLGDSLDGHLVSGHVDGMGEVTRFDEVGESHELRIQVPTELSKYLAYKGSVTVNGVSLTVNSVEDNANGCEISINIIPHTLQVTTLGQLKAGSKVNLEIDMIARYVERMLK